MTATDWQPYREHFARTLAEASPENRAELQRLGMAPFASDPDTTLHPARLMVVSMKPYGAADRSYPSGWDERPTAPGLHRWYDGGRAGSNFVREADSLLTYVIEQMGLAVTPREVFNVYAYFYRAADARQLKQFRLAALDTSDLHRRFLEIVAPRVILCIGNGEPPSAFATYCGILAGKPQTLRAAPRTVIKYFTTAQGVLVIGVPHLSYIRAATLLGCIGGYS